MCFSQKSSLLTESLSKGEYPWPAQLLHCLCWSPRAFHSLSSNSELFAHTKNGFLKKHIVLACTCCYWRQQQPSTLADRDKWCLMNQTWIVQHVSYPHGWSRKHTVDFPPSYWIQCFRNWKLLSFFLCNPPNIWPCVSGSFEIMQQIRMLEASGCTASDPVISSDVAFLYCIRCAMLFRVKVWRKISVKQHEYQYFLCFPFLFPACHCNPS